MLVHIPNYKNITTSPWQASAKGDDQKVQSHLFVYTLTAAQKREQALKSSDAAPGAVSKGQCEQEVTPKSKMRLSRDLWGSSNQIHQGPASPERIEEEAGQGVLTPQPEQASWGRGIDGGKVQSTPHIRETFYCLFLMLWSWFQTNCLWILKLFLQAFIQQHQTLYSQTAAVCIRVSFGHVCQHKRHE